MSNNIVTSNEIVSQAMILLSNGKVRNHKLGNSARKHSGTAETEEYHIFRNYLPTKNAYDVYHLTGSDNNAEY